MSTDWNVYCRTCDKEHGFYDANHAIELMRALIRIAPLIAACAPAEKALSEGAFAGNNVALRFLYGNYGPVSAEWFAAHLGHDLVPRSEYGDCDDECGEWNRCACCGDASKQCRLRRGHPGDHNPLRPAGS